MADMQYGKIEPESEGDISKDVIEFILKMIIDTSAETKVLRSLIEQNGTQIDQDEYERMCKIERRKQIAKLAQESSELGKLAAESMKNWS